jgi:hypothetical protein
VELVAKLKSIKAKQNNTKPDMLRLKGFKVKRGIERYAHVASERLFEAQSVQDFMSQILGMLIENLRRDDSHMAKTQREQREQSDRNGDSHSWALPTNIHRELGYGGA